MAELVGYARCPCCDWERAGVFKNKRGKLVLNCRKAEGGAGCSTFLYQSLSAQESLRKITTFISENPAPPVTPPEPVQADTEPEKAPVASEPIQNPVPVKKQKFSLFRK